MPSKLPITVAHADGIGPEIMVASLHVLNAIGAAIDIETLDISEMHISEMEMMKTGLLRRLNNNSGYTPAQGH